MRKELILEIIRERWSPSAFSSVPVEEFTLKAMFEAASFAPSSNNEQPWMFVYTTQQDSRIFQVFLGFLTESNRLWANKAYALVISLARTKLSFNGKPNRFAFHDTGMAVSNLLLQAFAMDVYIHQMGGFSIEKVKEYLKLPVDIEPVAMMAVGYLGEEELFGPELLKREEKQKPRKSVNDYVFRNSLSGKAFEK